MRLGPLALVAPALGVIALACTGASTPGPATTVASPPAGSSSPTLVSPCAAVVEAPLTGDTARLDFDAAPPAPLAPCPDVLPLDVQVHSRDADRADLLEPMDAHHGEDCAPFPATHRTAEAVDAVYLCRGHLMTAINATGYGAVYLTPAAAVDLGSTGEAVIRWDISTLRSSSRDWWDVWVTPWEDVLVLPLDGDLPDLSGEPRNAIHVRLTTENAVCPRLFVDGSERLGGDFASGCAWWRSYDEVLEPSAVRRTTFELRLSRTTLAIGIPELDLWWFAGALPVPLPFDLGIVQFGHHSYNPTKDGGTPNTWHWDNLEISPARPIGLARAAEGPAEGQFTFPAPAPAGAVARFAAGGGVVEVDDGRGWRRVEPAVPTDGFRRASYAVSVAEGTRQVRIRTTRGNSWYAGPYLVRDVALWWR